MAGVGHQDAFLGPRLSARYRFSQGTLAGARGNGPDAPIPDLRAVVPGRGGSTKAAVRRARGSLPRDWVTTKYRGDPQGALCIPDNRTLVVFFGLASIVD